MVRLGVVNQSRAGSLQTGFERLDGLQSTELGVGSGLLDFFRGDFTSSDLLEHVDHGLAGRSHLADVTGQGDGQQPGVGVGVVGGRDLQLLDVLGGLREQREARGPFDGGLAAQQRRQHRHGRLVACGAEGTGAREGQHEGVAGLAGDPLLASVVFRRAVVLHLVRAGAAARAGQALEELADALRQVRRRRARADQCDVGLGVRVLGEFRHGLRVQVLVRRRGANGRDACAQSAVEGQSVGRVDSNGLGVRREEVLLQLEEVDDVLVQFVGL